MSGEPTEVVHGAPGDDKTHPTHIRGKPHNQPKQIRLTPE
jgi:hypothetical protein